MSTTCPACGLPASGNFCNSCGARLGPRSCPSCQAALSAEARFCHRCGSPAGGGAGSNRASGTPASAASSSSTPWIVAASAIVLLLALIVYEVVAKRPTAVVPDMANTGAAASGAGPAAGGPAPDISRMTPRERFDRLFDRIMTAAERGDTAAVVQFAPMALGAYSMLDTVDADARYHAAMIHLGLGEVPEAEALADTILRINPGHLFGYMIRGEAARQQNNAAGLAQSQRDFLAHYDAELKADRLEYREHRPVIDEFRAEAGKRN